MIDHRGSNGSVGWQTCPAIALLIALAVVSLWTSGASAQSGDLLVTKAYRGQNSLRVETFSQFGAQRTIGNAEITIKDVKGPSPRDRDLTIVLYNNPYGTAIEGFSYSVSVTLPEGQTSVSIEIPYFDGGQQSAWDVGVFENGRDIEDRRATQKLNGNSQTFQWSYQSNTTHNTFIAIQGSAESLNEVRTDVLKLYGIPATATNNVGIRGVPTGSAQLAIAQLHDDWRVYMLGTSWVISAATLREVHERLPEKATGLRQYVASGGTLVVHSVDAVGLGNIVEKQFLRVRSNSPATWTYAEASLNKNMGTKDFTHWEPILGEVADATELTSLSTISLTEALATRQSKTSDTIQIVQRKYLAGEVIGVLLDPADLAMPKFNTAFSATSLGQTSVTLPDGSIVFTDNDVQSLVDAVENAATENEPAETTGTQKEDGSDANEENDKGGKQDEDEKVTPGETLLRFQMASISQFNHQTTDPASVAADGNWFWKNLIASVGKPPVWVFAALVAIFGALLGPGLLFLTGRIGRRSLMIFMVPAISLVATFAIVSYGVLHEGFENNGRITSVTYTCDDGPESFVWSRQTYFSGLPPRDGLKFRSNTYARPVYPDFDNNYSGSVDPRDAVTGRVLLTGDEQRWLGWVRARQQQQLLVGHPAENLPELLSVTYTDEAPTDPREMNEEETELLAEAMDSAPLPDPAVAKFPNIRVKNLSDQTLPFVVIHGTDKQYYFCDELGSGEEAIVPPLSDRETGARVGIKMVDIRPETPPEMEDGGSVFDFGRASTSSRYNESEDVLNLALKNYFGSKLDMKPFSYATIIRENPLLEIPLESQIDDSLHLVIGEHFWEGSDIGN